MDIVTTLVGLARGGVEINPIAGWIGLHKLLALKVLIVPLLVLACWLQESRNGEGKITLKIFTLISAVPVVWNTIMICR